MTDTVELEEWLEEQKNLLDEFAAQWKSSHDSVPDGFPMAMTLVEWDERFLTWAASAILNDIDRQ
jgi:hypothetical protein